MIFQVKVQPHGYCFKVNANETVLAAALRQGVLLPHGCRQGDCGSCRGMVQAGEIDYGDGRRPAALTAEEQAKGQALFCQAIARSDLDIVVPGASLTACPPVRTLTTRIAGLDPLCHDVTGVFLQLPKREPLAYLAGQYLEILLDNGRGRAYSIANAPGVEPLLELHIRQVPGGFFSEQVLPTLQPKGLIKIRAPLGSFFVRHDNPRPIILVGGGTGLAPLQAMLQHSLAGPDPRAIHLFWGVRAGRDLYRHRQLLTLAEGQPRLRYTPVLSAPQADERWDGATGFVHEAVVAHYPDLSGHQVYMSGPPAMIDAAKTRFAAHGLMSDQLFYDTFTPAADRGT